MPVKKKQENIENQKIEIEKLLAPYGKPEPRIKMENPLHYKNRVYRMLHHEKDGTPISGYFSKEENRVIKIEETNDDDLKCQEIIHTITRLAKSFKIKTYNPKSGHGLLRYVMVRRGMETNEIMVVLVLSSMIMPSKNNFAKELRKIHPEISTIIINENYKNGDNILGEKEANVFGKGFILDTFAGKQFRISSRSQFPINTVQEKKVCDTILKWCDFKGHELVLDAYCGIGTYSLVMSDYARKIYCVESSNELYRDTISNIRRNKIKNIDAYKNLPEGFLMQMANSEKEPINTIIVSQPYRGTSQEFISAVKKADPKKLIYIGKNPKSFISELESLDKIGYKVKKSVVVDIMPETEKVEIIVLLTK